MNGLYARQRGDCRRCRIRHRRGRRWHEPARPDGAGHSPGARGLRPDYATSTACSAPPTQARTSAMSLCEYLRLEPRLTLTAPSWAARRSRFTWRTPRRALAAGPVRVAVIAYGSTQRTVGARQASAREIQPLRDAVPPVLPVDRLRARRVAPHAPVRHDARAARRGRGGGTPMGAAQSGAWEKRAARPSSRCSARAWSAIRSRCATAAWSPTAAAPS